jgi:hypothetical protein
MKKILLVVCSLVLALVGCMPNPFMYVADNGTRYVDLSGTYLSTSYGSGNVTATGGIIGRVAIFDNTTSITSSAVTEAQLVGVVGSSHAQNTDTILTTNGVTPLINAGVLVNDLKTDRWATASNFNTMLGVNVAGNDDLAAGGVDNTAIGYDSMYDITTGFGNTAVGANSLENVLDGYYNTAVGNKALSDVGAGTNNTAVGELAGGNISTGSFNTAIGSQALLYNNGNYNTALGQWAGDNCTGSGNVFIGYSAGQDSLAISNKLYIANSNDTTPLIYGDFVTDDVVINGDTQITEDLYFPTAGGGLPYGCIYSNTINDITCTLQNAWYQVPFDNAGVSNLTTVSVANDDITILKTGNYQVTFNVVRHTHFAHDYEYMIKTNNGTVDVVNARIYSTSLGTGKLQSFSHTAITTFTANDTVEVWTRCTDAAGMVLGMDHVNMNVTMVGR